MLLALTLTIQPLYNCYSTFYVGSLFKTTHLVDTDGYIHIIIIFSALVTTGNWLKWSRKEQRVM